LIEFLEMSDVLESHLEQLAAYGGASGIRDLDLLDSALAQPQASFGGQYLHADLDEMAAAYLFHIVQNHPFVDGNKRVGLEAALTFLAINGVEIEATDDELVNMVLATAQGNLEKPAIAVFFRSHHAA
jgi:death on curing protein